ncbi:MAG: hypothetical protein ACLPKB_22530 [Xanthobacteraceae bacterium]
MPIAGDANWAQALQVGASILGFGFIAFQIWLIRRSIAGATHDRLYIHYHQIIEYLTKHEEMLPYFRGDKSAKDADECVRQRLDLASEAILGLLEHAAVQKGNIPQDSWEHCWEPYSALTFKGSRELRNFFSLHRSMYTHALQAIFDRINSP